MQSLSEIVAKNVKITQSGQKDITPEELKHIRFEKLYDLAKSILSDPKLTLASAIMAILIVPSFILVGIRPEITEPVIVKMLLPVTTGFFGWLFGKADKK